MGKLTCYCGKKQYLALKYDDRTPDDEPPRGFFLRPIKGARGADGILHITVMIYAPSEHTTVLGLACVYNHVTGLDGREVITWKQRR